MRKEIRGLALAGMVAFHPIAAELPVTFKTEQVQQQAEQLSFEQAKSLALQKIDQYTAFTNQPEKKDALSQKIFLFSNIPDFSSSDARTINTTIQDGKPLQGIAFVDQMKMQYPQLTDLEIARAVGNFSIFPTSRFILNGKAYINLDRVNTVEKSLPAEEDMFGSNAPATQYTKENTTVPVSTKARLANVVLRTATALNSENQRIANTELVNALKDSGVVDPTDNRQVTLSGFAITSPKQAGFETQIEEYLAQLVNNSVGDETYFSYSTPKRNTLLQRIFQSAGLTTKDVLAFHQSADIGQLLTRIGHTAVGVDVTTDEKALKFAIQNIFLKSPRDTSVENYYPTN